MLPVAFGLESGDQNKRERGKYVAQVEGKVSRLS